MTTLARSNVYQAESDQPGATVRNRAMQFRLRSIFITFAVLAAVMGAVVTVRYSSGRFSYINYQRIAKGMSIVEVEELLGSSGTEVKASQVLLLNQKPVVRGERYFRWDAEIRRIYVSLNNDVVAEKYYWSPSL